MSSLVCVPIMVETVEAALADAHQARVLGADLVEFRIDGFFAGDGDDEGRLGVLQLAAESPVPCIVTCRAADEGGEYEGDESARISLYEALGASDHPPAYLDLEHASFTRSANLRQKALLSVAHAAQPRDLSTGLILSMHDFEARPTDLFTRLAAMREVEAAKVLKVAYRARSLRDNLDLFDVLGERDRPTIALGMGEFGLMSRVLAPKFSGFLTFASIRDTSATAPGQPTVSDLLGLYRFRSITPATRVYGVIGWPVGHSISPQVHNAAFEAMDEDAVYLPLPIVPEYEPFKATVLALLDHAALGFTGASVTIPHKLHLVRLASEDTSRRWVVDEVASRVGAANTLAVDADGTCRVLNTDVAAAVEPLAEAMGGVADRRIAVLGAGGVGQAIAAGLADAGAHVTMHNRTMDKAAAALRKINSEHRLNSSPTGTIDIAPLESAGRSGCDAFVNCTALGMRGSAERETASPLSDLDFDALRGDEVVFDTVYTPRETPFLKSAAAKGLLTIRGETMFIRQALGQLAAWTGKTPPRGLVEKVAVEALERA